MKRKLARLQHAFKHPYKKQSVTESVATSQILVCDQTSGFMLLRNNNNALHIT